MSHPIWEYEWTEAPTSRNLEEFLNERGAQGWELVTLDFGGAIWKRHKVEPTAEDLARLEEEREEWQQMLQHLRDDHNFVIYIGNPHEEHAERFPHCEFPV